MKKIFAFLTPVLSLFLVFLCSCASQDTLLPSDLTVEELEKKMEQSMDPDNLYATSKSCFIRQEVTTPMWLDEPIVQLVETKMLFPDKFQITTSEENEPLQTISSDGVHGWITDYHARRISMLEGKALRQILTMTRLSGPSERYSEFFPSVKVEKCINGDGSFYLLTCEAREGGEFKIYVDDSTFLVKRMIADMSVGNTSVKCETRILSYSRFSGVLFPRETETVANGQLKRAKVITYQLNAPVKDEDFIPPAF